MYDPQFTYKVASLYYKNNLTQESVARKLSISKYKVNRILKSALIQGIVQIKIIKPKVNIKRNHVI